MRTKTNSKRKTPPFNNQALHAHTHRQYSSPFYTLECFVNFLRLPIWVTHTRPFGRTIHLQDNLIFVYVRFFVSIVIVKNFDRETNIHVIRNTGFAKILLQWSRELRSRLPKTISRDGFFSELSFLYAFLCLFIICLLVLYNNVFLLMPRSFDTFFY